MAAAVEGNALCTSPSMELFRAPDISALRKETIYILVKKLEHQVLLTAQDELWRGVVF